MEVTEKEMMLAQKTLDTICAMLDEGELKYRRDDEKLHVHVSFSGYDFPLDLIFVVYPHRELVVLYVPLSFTIPEEGRGNVGIAMTLLNYSTYDGTWTMDLGTGEAEFRMTNLYFGSILGKDCFKLLMNTAINAFETCADKLFMVGKGTMSLNQLTEALFGR